MTAQSKAFLALLAVAGFFVPVHIIFDVLQYSPVGNIFAVTIINYVSIHPVISTFVENFLSLNRWTQTFISLFIFRYTRLVVNTISFLTCKETPIPIFPNLPTLRPKDVTVIVPSVEPSGDDFINCISSIKKNHPAKIIIVTAGPGKEAEAKGVCSSYDDEDVFELFHCNVPNKRSQVCKALPEV